MTKFIKTLLAAVTATVLVLALPVFSVSAFSTGLEVSSAELQKGNTAEVAVSILNNPGIAAAGFKIHYDTSALVLVNAYYTDLFGNVVNTVNSSSSSVLFNFVNSENVYGNGVLLKLEFKASEDAAPGVYSVIPELLGESGYVVRREADGSISDVALVLSGGTVTVKEKMCVHSNTASVLMQDASCTESGTLQLHCSDCGAVISEEYIPPRGHSFSQWILQKQPTVAEEGEEARTCFACGVAEVRSVQRVSNSENGAETAVPDTAPPLGDSSSYLFLFAFFVFAVMCALKAGKQKNS